MHSLSNQKTGRNDPCRCGSGKKYKHCCLSNSTGAFPGPEMSGTAWSRQRDASHNLSAQLQKFLKRNAHELGEFVLDAWIDFNQDEDPALLSEMPEELSIFCPYMLFNWTPEKALPPSTAKPQGGLLIQTYLKNAANRLSDLEHLIVEQAITRPVSFYEIVRVNPGRGALVRDILTGEETEIEEHSGIELMRRGDVLYGQLWILPEITTLGRSAPIRIPPGKKVKIIKLRAQLQRKIKKQNRGLSPDDLISYSDQIRTVYLEIRDALSQPPEVQNTDGDPFLSHTIRFNIQSAERTFDALASLAWGLTREEMLEQADRKRDGSLRSIDFAWIKPGNKMHKAWPNTVMGHLKIREKTLLVEVNSVNRAKRIRKEIERRLGSEAIHVSTEWESPDQVRERAKEMKSSLYTDKKTDEDDPEVRLQIEALLQKQVEGWVHTKVPALDGRTPIEAVADPDGREMVEALQEGFERQNEIPADAGIVRADVGVLRRLLNLFR
jgi:SEC-C motif